MLIATEIEYEASPVDIAEEFLDMSVEEQADTLYLISCKLNNTDELRNKINDLGYKDNIKELSKILLK